MEKKLTILIDFDGVIHDHLHPAPGQRMGPPMLGAIGALRTLHNEGHTIIIFTCRGDSPAHIRKWLHFFDADEFYDQITDQKLPADLYIDDKAIRFTSWRSVLTMIPACT